MDLYSPIKLALTKAKEMYEAREHEKAAAAYDKAASLMAIYAEQAIGRDAEMRRRKKAMEYREIAKKLRSGEIEAAGAKEDRDEAPAPAANGAAPEGKNAKAAGEVKAAVLSLIKTSSITWGDIGGLEPTKEEVKYALGITLAKQPVGVQLSAWTNILFYGPPGTGKTLLAAATSHAIRNTDDVPAVFFNVKVSSILSKYFGESSKIISELYGTARDTSPAVIFLDEFESVAGKRDDQDSGPERRILSTLLSELDGMEAKGRRDIYVLTIAATNRPWDLDPAVLSRFEKKILIPLPDTVARREILRIHLDKRGFQLQADLATLAAATEGYSGREIERLCKEVTTRMVAEMNRDIPGLIDKGLDEVRKYQLKVRPLTLADFQKAAAKISPQTTAADVKKYNEWREAQVE
ncbi:MAG: ATP-binding protein [Planctomycetes bacterium]|nr:ATP-binding protein [Planctomycetota bacterium]